MKVDPRIIDILKKKEVQELLFSVGAEIIPGVIKGILHFAGVSAKKVKDTIIIGKDKVNEGYESLKSIRRSYKRIKEKVIPFPSNYSRAELKNFSSQSSIYLKQRFTNLEKNTLKKKFEEYQSIHISLEETVQHKDFEEYVKLYIGNNKGNYFMENENLKNDFINIMNDYRKVVTFLYNVKDGKKSEIDIMKELSKEKPVTNI